MFLTAIVLALVVGALAGGGLPRLADLQLRWLAVLAAALFARIGAHLIGRAQPESELLVSGLFVGGYLLLFAWLWRNKRVPGLQVAAVGIAANSLAVLANAGRMPVWSDALAAAGIPSSQLAGDPFHFLASPATSVEFLRQAVFLGDVIPVPFPLLRDVASLGDVLLAVGIFWAIVFTMTRPPDAAPRGGPARYRPAAFGQLQAAAAEAAGSAIGRPVAATGSQAEAMLVEASIAAPPIDLPGAPLAGAGTAVAPAPAVPQPRRLPSPYLALIRNANFSLLWVGQVVSLFGDRLHQVALGVLVLALTGSELALGLTFAAATVPNLVLAPLAGAFVDRWDHRRAMIGCDLVRAGLTVLVPFAVLVDVVLVYPIAFLIATVSLVFRPAKNAVIPAIVRDRQLLTANSASSISETIGDLIGYPAAGLLVAALGPLIAAAFFFDAATYLISAVLIAAMAVPGTERVVGVISVRAIWREMADGWRFLRRHEELFVNTVISVVAQVAVGTEIVVSWVYARDVLESDPIGFPQNYTILMAAIGLGTLVGGLWVGTLSNRHRKGLLATAGFLVFGLLMAVVGLVTNVFVAAVLFFALGAVNMVFVIPNMTLFQERTPSQLMGRVVSIRMALVFGVMTAAMAGSGLLAGLTDAGLTFAVAGLICAAAGAVGFIIPAMRNAA